MLPSVICSFDSRFAVRGVAAHQVRKLRHTVLHAFYDGVGQGTRTTDFELSFNTAILNERVPWFVWMFLGGQYKPRPLLSIFLCCHCHVNDRGDLRLLTLTFYEVLCATFRELKLSAGPKLVQLWKEKIENGQERCTVPHPVIELWILRSNDSGNKVCNNIGRGGVLDGI
jgi:hypothetical protein